MFVKREKRHSARNQNVKKLLLIFAPRSLTKSRECVPDGDPGDPESSFAREDTNRARSGHGGTLRDREVFVINTVKMFEMDAILILSTARKAVLARLASLGRHFCDDDVNEMVSLTVERFYTHGSYDPSKSSVQTYVSRIAFNVVYDFVKKVDQDHSLFFRLDGVLDAESDSERPLKADPVRNHWFADTCEADSFLLAEEEEVLLARAKNRLSPMHRKCYDLLAEGKSHEEVAHLTGTTVSNVGVVAHRMRKQFRILFEEVA